ncbi:GNAT family N-acetyltransferase [Clostridiaceae bacterium M8S5]|nr:GNAT family N-acetyltransferase [Clostridiaceae bacterium M8S5]
MEGRLVKYTEIKESAYINYIKEWEDAGIEVIPGASKRSGKEYNELLEKWSSNETDKMYDKGLVASTLYFLVDEDEKILGAIDLRHKLNEALTKHGGHIGYGVRPSERKKGYATVMLSKLLEMLRTRGYDKVLITCADTNEGSARTIEKNGGKLWDKPVFEEMLIRRYWIEL